LLAVIVLLKHTPSISPFNFFHGLLHTFTPVYGGAGGYQERGHLITSGSQGHVWGQFWKELKK
jgi:hypothetical protein